MSPLLGVIAESPHAEEVYESRLSGRFARVLDCLEIVTTIIGEDSHWVLYMVGHFLDEYFKQCADAGIDRSVCFEFSRQTLELMPSNALAELFGRQGVSITLKPELHMYRLQLDKDAVTPTCRLEVKADGSTTFNDWTWLSPLGAA